MNRTTLIVMMLGAALLIAAPASAAPLWSMKVDGAGVPLVLQATGGFGAPRVGVLGVTEDGYIAAMDGSGSGHEIHILDPAGEEANNAVSGAAQAAVVRTWDTNREIYLAGVASGVKDDIDYCDGLTRAVPGGSGAIFWFSGGGTAEAYDVRFEDAAGNYDADGGFGANRGKSSDTTNTGLHKAGLALIGETSPGSDVLNMLAGQSTVGAAYGAPINNSILKQQWGALSGLDIGTATEGTRVITGGGKLTDGISYTSMLANLVPGIADDVMEMAYNVLDGNLYFVSQDTTNGKVYVSAVSLPGDAFTSEFGNDSVVTTVDLDPDTANDYLDITYLAALNANDLTGADLVESLGIGFSPDGSVMYIGNEGDGTSGSSDRVFIFETTIPEPATMALLAIGGIGMVGAAVRRRRRS
jgi:hypothetical protein